MVHSQAGGWRSSKGAVPGLWQAGELLWVFRLVRSTFLRRAVKLNAVAEAGTFTEL